MMKMMLSRRFSSAASAAVIAPRRVMASPYQQQAAPAVAHHNPKSMKGFLNEFVEKIKYPVDTKHRYFVVAHLFDDTQRMLDSLSPSCVKLDAVVGVPYSSGRPETIRAWQNIPEYGDRVHVEPTMADMEILLLEQLEKTLSQCAALNQEMIVVDCGGYVAPLLHEHFPNQVHLVKGVVEITKQGVWRAQAIPNLAIPVFHCADSELKRLEAKRCGETVARCIDGVAREMGLSLAGRQATVLGAGWIGSGLASALKRLDMIPTVVDKDPVKVVEARLNGFLAVDSIDQQGNNNTIIEESDLIVGTTGQTSITSDILDRVSGGTMVASSSSRQVEIDVGYLENFEVTSLSETVDSYMVEKHSSSAADAVLLLNKGFPVNFIPSSGSVADEIVEMILAEMIVLMKFLALNKVEAGVHRIPIEQERVCADLWLKLRHRRPLSPQYSSMSALSFPQTARRAFLTATYNDSSNTTDSGSISSDHDSSSTTTDDHSTYLVNRLIGQKPNLYGVAKFAIIAEDIRRVAENLDRPVRILDLGCSTAISKEYLQTELGDQGQEFDYCGVDYEAAFEPDIVMDITEIHQRREEIPWTPDIILLLDVLEHLPGKAKDIAQVMAECDKLIPEHGLVLAVVPQLYRLDRLKLGHLHYPEHQVRLTLEEWQDIIAPVTKIERVQGIGYISCLSYLPMLSPWYKEDNNHGALFRYLRGSLLEWGPLKPLEIALTRFFGNMSVFKGWCNSSLMVCQGSSSLEKKKRK